ncbi:hypothetical protein PTKIN_Ptkin06aG0018900 [Pterospermum kingtungense]
MLFIELGIWTRPSKLLSSVVFKFEYLYATLIRLPRLELRKTKGGKVTREPVPVKGRSIVIAFVEDLDGYKFELIERQPTHEPLCQVMLRVSDLDHSINFYEKAFGMKLFRTRDNPQYKVISILHSICKIEPVNCVFSYNSHDEVTDYDKGNARPG